LQITSSIFDGLHTCIDKKDIDERMNVGFEKNFGSDVTLKMKIFE
jgi:hypothetical protein